MRAIVDAVFQNAAMLDSFSVLKLFIFCNQLDKDVIVN